MIAAALDLTSVTGRRCLLIHGIELLPFFLLNAGEHIANLIFRMAHKLYAGENPAVWGDGKLFFPQLTAFGTIGALVNVRGYLDLEGGEIELFLPQR